MIASGPSAEVPLLRPSEPRATPDLAGKVVWIVWLVMLLVALACIALYSRNIPITEDWYMVPTLTGNEPEFFRWLWSQNNEHRIPLPRLVLLTLLKATGGDFRSGMVFNVVVLAALAAAMIRAAQRLRGRSSYADAFFPIALLHLGHWENLFWSWQVGFVLPTAFILAIFLILIRDPMVESARAATAAGLFLVLLPLCGANGLIFVPPLALWFGYSGLRQFRSKKTGGSDSVVGGILIGSSAGALLLTALYFVGYVRPSWTPPNPGLAASLHASMQFLAMGFGPVSRNHWTVAIVAILAILIPTAGLAAIAAIRKKSSERFRALGILVFAGSVGVFALAVGWGRAAVIPIYGSWPIRYVLLAVPALIVSYFVWELYGSRRLRTAFQFTLFLGFMALVPINTIHGFWWNDWYQKGARAIEKDLVAGATADMVARDHRAFLFHSIETAELERMILMLREAGLGPFARVHADGASRTHAEAELRGADKNLPVKQEIWYRMPEAAEVFLVWGINGWKPVSDELRPFGTYRRDDVLYTPMKRTDDQFVAELQVPSGAIIDYAFQITKTVSGTSVNVWDTNGAPKRDYHTVASKEKIAQITILNLKGMEPLPESR